MAGHFEAAEDAQCDAFVQNPNDEQETTLEISYLDSNGDNLTVLQVMNELLTSLGLVSRAYKIVLVKGQVKKTLRDNEDMIDYKADILNGFVITFERR